VAGFLENESAVVEGRTGVIDQAAANVGCGYRPQDCATEPCLTRLDLDALSRQFSLVRCFPLYRGRVRPPTHRLTAEISANLDPLGGGLHHIASLIFDRSFN
jgi:hypothetical protein